MAIHPTWRKCRCGCGCGHRCNRIYGPYYIDSTRTTSKYIGKIDKALDMLAGNNPQLREAIKQFLITKALESAIKMKLKGYEPTPTWKRSEHVHTKRRRKRKEQPSKEEIEFWKLYTETIKKLSS